MLQSGKSVRPEHPYPCAHKPTPLRRHLVGLGPGPIKPSAARATRALDSAAAVYFIRPY
jgi:hypothetical protein